MAPLLLLVCALSVACASGQPHKDRPNNKPSSPRPRKGLPSDIESVLERFTLLPSANTPVPAAANASHARASATNNARSGSLTNKPVLGLTSLGALLGQIFNRSTTNPSTTLVTNNNYMSLAANDSSSAATHMSVSEATDDSGQRSTNSSDTGAITDTSRPQADNGLTSSVRPEMVNVTRPVATNTSRPITTNTSRPATTTRANVTNTFLPNVTHISRPNVTNTSLPNVTHISRPNVTNTSLPNATHISRPNVTNTSLPNSTNISRPPASNIFRPEATNTSRPVVTPAPDSQDRSTLPPSFETSQPSFNQEDIEIDELKCVSNDMCILELQRLLPWPREGVLPEDIDIISSRDVCGYEEADREDIHCCKRLVKKIKHSRGSTPKTLQKAECSTLYCGGGDGEFCRYIGCEVPSCDETPGHGLSSPSPSPSGTSAADPSSLTGDDDSDPNVLIIVVSCLLTFIAGAGGAILIFCILRRRKIAKGSSTREAAYSTNSNAAFVAGKGADESFYEELPNNNMPDEKPSNKPSAVQMNSENEYTYIPEHALPTPSYETPGPPVASTYNVPGDHLVNRKLPAAPTPRAAQPLDNNRSADQLDGNQASTNLPFYSLAKTPASEAKNVEQGFDPKEKRETSLSGKPPEGQYFILEEQNDSTGMAPTGGRETTVQTSQQAANSGHYSSLSPVNPADAEYTALENGKEKAVTTPEYLELLPDHAEYSLQKPVD